LHDPDIDALIEQRRREGVSEAVRVRVNARLFAEPSDGEVSASSHEFGYV
jgi:hypothetical protein